MDKNMAQGKGSSAGVPRDVRSELVLILKDVLGLKNSLDHPTLETPLLGAIPALDSLGVVGIITAIEKQFGINIYDDEIDGELFKTFGSLVAFVEKKLR